MTMSEPGTLAAKLEPEIRKAASLEAVVRSALTRLQQLSRVAAIPEHHDEAAAVIMRAVEAAQPRPVLVLVRLLDDGRVIVTNEDYGDRGLALPARDWADFVAGVKAGDFDEMVTAPASATVAEAEPSAGPPAGDGKEAAARPPARPVARQRARAGKPA